MKINLNEQPDPEVLPEYGTCDVAAEFIGCDRKTVFRWLKDFPNLGIKVVSHSGRTYRVLAKDEIVKLRDHIMTFHRSQKQ